MLFALVKTVQVIWALPYTLMGIALGLLGLISGGRCIKSAGAIEFHGGAVTWFLNRIPIKPSAMTLGHVIIGQTLDDLERTRDHEMVHVRQYERWGIFFGPAYFICSLIALLNGKNYYRDNAFEVEAYSTTTVRPRAVKSPSGDDEIQQ